MWQLHWNAPVVLFLLGVYIACPSTQSGEFYPTCSRFTLYLHNVCRGVDRRAGLPHWAASALHTACSGLPWHSGFPPAGLIANQTMTSFWRAQRLDVIDALHWMSHAGLPGILNSHFPVQNMHALLLLKGEDIPINWGVKLYGCSWLLYHVPSLECVPVVVVVVVVGGGYILPNHFATDPQGTLTPPPHKNIGTISIPIHSLASGQVGISDICTQAAGLVVWMC